MGDGSEGFSDVLFSGVVGVEGVLGEAEGAGVEGSAFDGTGGWDMEMEVMVPVKPPILSVDGLEGVEGVVGGVWTVAAGWEGTLSTGLTGGSAMGVTVGWAGMEGLGVTAAGRLTDGCDGIGWLGAGVTDGLLAGGSAAWGKEERGLGCWADIPPERLRNQMKSPAPKANNAVMRITILEDPPAGAGPWPGSVEGLTVFSLAADGAVLEEGDFDCDEETAGAPTLVADSSFF